jgi:hypothetical protein
MGEGGYPKCHQISHGGGLGFGKNAMRQFVLVISLVKAYKRFCNVTLGGGVSINYTKYHIGGEGLNGAE